MIFKSITLYNFKMYEGANKFDLSIDQEEDSLKNIILIGGLNGNGKTSILEAVQLCLYGKRAKYLLRASEYESFVTSRFSRNALKKGETKMKVTIEFEDLVLHGLSHTLYVERTWNVRNYTDNLRLSGDSDFLVRRDSNKVNKFSSSNFTGDEAEDFINGIIPPEISQFFFFDGEKIQEMAEDKNYGERISEALRDVMGISILGQLQKDLREVRSRYLKSAIAIRIKKDITEKDFEIASLEASIGESQDKIFELEEEIRNFEKDIQYVGDDLRRITKSAIQDRGDLKERETELKRYQSDIEDKLKEILELELPLGICSKLCGMLKERLELERDLQTQDKARQALKPKLDRLLLEVFEQGEDSKPSLLFTQKEFYKDKIRRVWYDIIQDEDKSVQIDKIWHDINDREYAFIRQQIDNLSQGIIPEFEEIIQERHRKTTEIRNIQKDLRDEGDSEILKKVEKKDLLNIEMERRKTDKNLLEDVIEKNRRQISSFKIQKEKLEKKMVDAEKAQNKVFFIEKIKNVLSEYETELKMNKISKLEDTIKDMFLRLCNKEDMIKDIEIDIQTFIVSIKDSLDRTIEKHNLSSGLKQIFAFSLLWGLTKVAKTEIPIIIDTPFGRLDSVHRTKIIRNYYPNAGRQVIILSTDTEIDKDNAKVLHHNIAKQYLLSRKSELESVKIENNYFQEN